MINRALRFRARVCEGEQGKINELLDSLDQKVKVANQRSRELRASIRAEHRPVDDVEAAVFWDSFRRRLPLSNIRITLDPESNAFCLTDLNREHTLAGPLGFEGFRYEFVYAGRTACFVLGENALVSRISLLNSGLNLEHSMLTEVSQMSDEDFVREVEMTFLNAPLNATSETLALRQIEHIKISQDLKSTGN